MKQCNQLTEMSSLTLDIIKNNYKKVINEFNDKLCLSTIYQELSDFMDIQLQSFSSIDCCCIEYIKNNVLFLEPEYFSRCCHDGGDRLDYLLLNAYVKLLSEKVITLTKEHNIDCITGGKCFNIQENIDRIVAINEELAEKRWEAQEEEYAREKEEKKERENQEYQEYLKKCAEKGTTPYSQTASIFDNLVCVNNKISTLPETLPDLESWKNHI